MGTLVNELTSLLHQTKPSTGVVVSMSDGVANIATARGMVQARVGSSVGVTSRVRVGNDGIARLAVVIPPSNIYSV